MKRYFIYICAAVLLTACGYKVNYSLTGASIPVDAKTFSVAYFPNNAPMVAPTLSSALTEALQDKFSRQTRLIQVQEGGDFAFEGEITNYMSATSTVTANDVATQNRLTITVQVRFKNVVVENKSFNKSFSAYADYDTNTPLQSAESELIPQITSQLATDIFQAAAADW
ncbi:MAG: LptE family protein [Alistipes sp.]